MEYEITLSSLNYIDKAEITLDNISSYEENYGIDAVDMLSGYLYTSTNERLSTHIFAQEFNAIKNVNNDNANEIHDALSTIFKKLLDEDEEDDLTTKMNKLKSKKFDI